MASLRNYAHCAILAVAILLAAAFMISVIYVEYTTGSIGFARMAIKVLTACGVLIWLIEKLEFAVRKS